MLRIHVNDQKIQDIGVRKFVYLYQYHTKSAISVFRLQKSS